MNLDEDAQHFLLRATDGRALLQRPTYLRGSHIALKWLHHCQVKGPQTEPGGYQAARPAVDDNAAWQGLQQLVT